MQQTLLFFSVLLRACDGAKMDDQVKSAAQADPVKSLAAMLSAARPASAFQAPRATGTLAKASRAAAAKMEADPFQGPQSLKDIAKQLNPAVGYWDPLQLGKQEFWGQSNDATVGFLRHSEIKHGRVAMAAFVGYLAQANGLVFPGQLTGDVSFADVAGAGSPPEQWDALPTASKLQILLFIGFLEGWSENSEALADDGEKHYMRGGKPGFFPKLQSKGVPHPALNLYDPFGLNSKSMKDQKTKDKKLLAEVNNGRLAMLGIMGFLGEQKQPNAIPFLSSIGDFKPYDGQIMAPFADIDTGLPFVQQMLPK